VRRPRDLLAPGRWCSKYPEVITVVDVGVCWVIRQGGTGTKPLQNGFESVCERYSNVSYERIVTKGKYIHSSTF
jgi:hypothetical protein